MNWYLSCGKDSDVVISTRIRYARNLKNYKFNVKDERQALQIENEIKSKLPSIGFNLKFCKMQDIDKLTKVSLLEKNLISPECAVDKNKVCSLLINDEENICIMINEEDHLREQVFGSGMVLEETFKLARELDEKIEDTFDIAKSKKYGYLTSCPTNVGTGMSASVMVHLPGLTKTGNIKKVLEAINNFGLNIRGIYGENSNISGDMYQISNKQTIGIKEEDIVKNLKIITEKIVEQEREARKLLVRNKIELEDMICRSFGIISNCKKISSEEARSLLSDVKLGTDLGILDKINDQKVKEMYLYSKPANLQKYIGKELSTYERDIRRADIIKEIINKM